MELTKEDYLKASKQITKTKEEMYLLVSVSYDIKLVLPYKQGMELISSLEHAMVFRDRYDKPPLYKPVEDELTIRPMSTREINQIKVAQLLGVTIDTAKKLNE